MVAKHQEEETENDQDQEMDSMEDTETPAEMEEKEVKAETTTEVPAMKNFRNGKRTGINLPVKGFMNVKFLRWI